jgi:hypothetical protein
MRYGYHGVWISPLDNISGIVEEEFYVIRWMQMVHRSELSGSHRCESGVICANFPRIRGQNAADCP